MGTDTSQSVVKPPFFDLCLELDDQALQEIADRAGVAKRIVDDMFLSIAVHRADAIKVLAAFSAYMGQVWPLDTVRVALLPLFTEIATTHNFDLAQLATAAGVAYDVIDKLLLDQPIPIQAARLVLQMASRLAKQHYTLDNVDVTLEEAQYG